MTRKIISMNGGFHTVIDINRLYAHRKNGGRGLKSIEDMYESRTIDIMKHLKESCNNNSLLQMARKNKENGIIRLGKQFDKRLQERQGTKKVTESMKKDHDDRIDQKATNS